ncbi:H-type lectin domain-containing protein [Rhodovulum imhoffii]|uniref:H-type lectin domain-containing protein n=2 Tax=Rhodovulum imhoffii TaxID=365340 RepID=A0A2T5BV49_9RHOB|nr:H-type lectin domain-containing protein [Rhodovulum imhoffii]
MWTGRGAREKRLWVKFSRSFHDAPSVFVGFSMWDLDAQTNPRADITSENITAQGFDLVFRTWSDTRVARIRADWMAIGPVAFEDDWNVGS